MKVIVAGGRDLQVTDSAVEGVIHLLRRIKATEVISGGARGGDQIGEVAARRLDLSVRTFPAQWERHGRSAGFIRNQEMADYAAEKPSGACILLPGGKGTDDMERRARERGLLIFKVELIHERSAAARAYGFTPRKKH